MMRLPERILVRGRETGVSAKLWRSLPYLVIVAVAAFLYHNADNFQFSRSQNRVGPDAWPKIILSVLMFTACVGVLNTIRANRVEKKDSSDEDASLLNPPEIYPRMVWAGVAATVVYVLALPILGFAIATVFYSIALMWVGHQRRLGVLLALGVIFSLLFMLLFMKAVYVSLPLGDEPFSKVSLMLMSIMGIH